MFSKISNNPDFNFSFKKWICSCSVALLSGMLVSSPVLASNQSESLPADIALASEIVPPEGDAIAAASYSGVSVFTLNDPDQITVTMNGVEKKYTGKCYNNISFNTDPIDLSSTPAIVKNSVLYVPAKKVFSEVLHTGYSFNETSRTLTLSQFNRTLSMKLDDKKVTLTTDTKTISKTISAAPFLVQYSIAPENTTSDIMVPVSSVCSLLGYQYSSGENSQKLITTDIAPSDNLTIYQTIQSPVHRLSDFNTYQNMIYNMRVSGNATEDVFFVNNIYSFKDLMQYSVDSSKKTVTLTFQQTLNECGSFIWDSNLLSEANYIKSVQVTNQTAKGKVTVLITYDSDCRAVVSTEKSVCSVKILSATYGYALNLVKADESITVESLTTSDYYWKNKFRIIIPGNYKDFYLQSKKIIKTEDTIKKYTVTYDEPSNRTYITVTTSKLQGFKLVDNGKYISVLVANPSKVYNKIVLIDAGHGGHDAGAISGGIKEKDINLAIAYKYAKTYFNSSSSDIKAYWTRRDDTFWTLNSRASYAKTVESDLFVSVHQNSSVSSSPNGFEVYYSSKNNRTQANNLTSKKMAYFFDNRLPSGLGLSSRGVKDGPNLYVLKYNSVPSVLLEIGFLSNSSNRSKLNDPAFQKKTAKIIYQSVSAVFESYETGR
ncbi:MAG: N-acetylmuramoyl-L-alanine amidase [Clostridiales bacterium]|nr:N-acetylmuramoyl-L-alanine amidase [Clostridiales bacterium]